VGHLAAAREGNVEDYHCEYSLSRGAFVREDSNEHPIPSQQQREVPKWDARGSSILPHVALSRSQGKVSHDRVSSTANLTLLDSRVDKLDKVYRYEAY